MTREFGPDDVQRHLVLADLIRELRDSYRPGAVEHGTRMAAVVPPRSTVELATASTVVGVMPAVSEADGVVMLKTAVCHRTRSQGRHIKGSIALISVRTGLPFAILDNGAVTDARCAAACAMTTEACTDDVPLVLGVVGTGPLALAQLRGINQVRSVTEVHVYGRNAERTRQFVAEAEHVVGPAVTVTITSSPAHAAQDCDVLCTATSHDTPLITLLPGRRPIHINCMGGHGRDRREVGNRILRSSILVVDDRTLARREIGASHDAALLPGDLLELPPEQRIALRTVFSSVGDPYGDLLTAMHVIRREAAARGSLAYR